MPWAAPRRTLIRDIFPIFDASFDVHSIPPSHSPTTTDRKLSSRLRERLRGIQHSYTDRKNTFVSWIKRLPIDVHKYRLTGAITGTTNQENERPSIFQRFQASDHVPADRDAPLSSAARRIPIGEQTVGWEEPATFDFS
ncbi:hypothetical protein WN55_09570 [Dufourea novaeangliae]|uniref:Uncharacterized protein n=1 Tax=Dufourea novaeangliae TaxID=178035 RepID=A0A154NYV8_DUFNO|nr:hypothetical protein WN55_09570 [Dufourea novaeangliae]